MSFPKLNICKNVNQNPLFSSENMKFYNSQVKITFCFKCFNYFKVIFRFRVTCLYFLLLIFENFYNFSFCRYDHLVTVLKVLLAQRPNNAVDILEDISREAKRSKFTSSADTIQDKLDSSTEVALAEIQKKLFTVSFSLDMKFLYDCFIQAFILHLNYSYFSRDLNIFTGYYK